MENRAFDGSPSTDRKNNPPGPSEPRVDPPGGSKAQAGERMAPLARISDDEGDESPSAYIRRYIKQEVKFNDLEDLEPPPPEQVEEPLLDPELQQQARRRRERRCVQHLVDGPCSLRPDPPYPAPEPYPDPDIGDQPDGATDPGQITADASNPGEPGGSSLWDRCASYYKRICSVRFQFPFHTLLITWPIATAVMGVLNLVVCDLNDYYPGIMIVVGDLGSIACLLRLFAVYFDELFTFSRTKNFWISIRTLEFVIFVLFAIQLHFFFKETPIFTPGEKHSCDPRVYKINSWLMFLSSVIMIGWLIVNFGNFIYWCKRRRVQAVDLSS